VKNSNSVKRAWLATTAVGALALAAPAFAQDDEAIASAANAANADGLLGEVVVTATRTATTVNRTPIAITAVNQRSMDQSGVKNLDDLSRTIPSVTFRKSGGGEGNPSVAIRGIGSVLGSSTTGIYLDDTPLQKRDGPGSATGNGSPFPPLFDLERVEVLRGPQGTLYGGSAEGGAVRFITPSPSLTRYSSYSKAEISNVKDGGTSYEAGVAVGGPIIPDKIGFRASVFGRHTAGYIDAVSWRSGNLVARDINTGNTKVARLAVTFAPFQNFRITPAVYASYDHVSAQDTYWLSVNQYTLNAGTFTNSGTVNGVRYNFPDKVFPGATYGPFNFGPYKNGAAVFAARDGTETKINSPRNTYILLNTLHMDYDLPWATVKSITSLLEDNNKGYSGGLQGCRTAICPTTTNSGFVGPTGAAVPGGLGVAMLGVPGQPETYRQFTYYNKRHSLTQEFRIASRNPDQRLTYVLGAWYQYEKIRQHTQSFDNENDSSRTMRGIDEAWLLGSTNLPGSNSSEREVLTDIEEFAGFGEINFAITPKLKATAGIRVSHYEIDYSQNNGGSVQGPPPGFVGIAPAGVTITDPRCGYDPVSCYSPTFRPFNDANAEQLFRGFQGKQKESPVTPKIGLSYQATETSLYYATVAKGYRTGGLNQPVPALNCTQDLQILGLTETPLTYNSDSVWSYEGGAKVRLFGNTQINSSAFYIDWKNPQLQNRLRCGQNYIVNAGRAVSKGFDVQTQSRIGPVTLNLLVAHTIGKYTQGFATPTPTGQTIIVNKGDELGNPNWQVSFGFQYDFRIMDKYGAFIRGDYQYNGTYKRGVGPGASGYNAFSYKGQATRFAQFRAGVSYEGVDVNVYVNNAFNSTDPLNLANADRSPLITASTFRPREVGLQLTHRY
jgi:outer membrane receptor protein involved in Fe transport